MPAPHPVADVLRLLADCDSTGSLQVTGPRAGTFHLELGRVVDVEAAGIPPGSWAGAVLDATVAILQHPAELPPRFAPGPRREPPAAGSHDVARLLLDVDRALAALARSPVTPDDRVVARRPRPRAVRLDAATWPLVGLVAQPVSAREIAWSLGRPVLGTVLALAGLVEQGACVVVAGSRPAAGPAPAAPVVPPVTRPIPIPPRPGPVRSRPVGRSGPDGAEDVEGVPPLPVRRPGAALDEAVAAGAASAGADAAGLGPAVTPVRPSPELVLRLMDGLRRL